MQVILLVRVPKLGQMGEVVTVKPGYARNFLLPQRMALPASKGNIAYFETQRAQLEAHNLTRRSEAEDMAKKLQGRFVVMIRQAGESGHLYGSVSGRDIADALTQEGVKVERSQIVLSHPIKELGIFPAKVQLHPDVEQTIHINVALTEEEADIQKKRFDKGEPAIQRTDV